MTDKKKVVVLGGGAAALSTVWAITNQPDWQQRFEITVYESSWRLGGKGASGRNEKYGYRIEEHGLHLWMGFYEDSFNVIRQVYNYCALHNLMPGSPLKTYQDAFTPLKHIAITEQVSGSYLPWILQLPLRDEYPGLPNPTPPTSRRQVIFMYIERMLDLCIHSIRDEERALAAAYAILPTVGVEDMDVRQAISYLKEAREVARNLVNGRADSSAADSIPPLLDKFIISFQRALFSPETLIKLGPGLRHLKLTLDIAIPVMRGLINDRVFTRGFEPLDNEEFASWLRRHGCSVPHNAVSTAFYDACFAYQNGETSDTSQNMAAGTMLNGLLRLGFTYHGSMMFKMNGGMGDVVFAPLYLALRNRGVAFKFFNRVTDIQPSSDLQSIDTVHIDVQAEPGLGEYDPLIVFKGMPCWPSKPKAGSLNQRARADRTTILHSGSDFDVLINGLPLGILPSVASKLIAVSPQWQDMISHVAVVRTQAFQLWLKNEIGTATGKAPKPEVNVGFVEPFDTWADMSHLIRFENVPDCLAIAYFCNAFPSTATPGNAAIAASAANFLDGPMLNLWPGAMDSATGRFRRDFLVPFGVDLGKELSLQYYRVNTDPQELYTQSVAKSTPFRIFPGQSGFTNMVIAGDWTKGDLNIGCLEAAVQSGLLAANSVCGAPAYLQGPFGLIMPITKGTLT